jgi:hypothetical protein
MSEQPDRPLAWQDVVQPDTQDSRVIESQEAEKERVYGYLNHCQANNINPDSLSNWQTYQNQQQ